MTQLKAAQEMTISFILTQGHGIPILTLLFTNRMNRNSSRIKRLAILLFIKMTSVKVIVLKPYREHLLKQKNLQSLQDFGGFALLNFYIHHMDIVPVGNASCKCRNRGHLPIEWRYRKPPLQQHL